MSDHARNCVEHVGVVPGTFTLLLAKGVELVAERHDGSLSLLVIKRTDLNNKENPE